jgi:aldose 1-epimerase
MITTIKKTINDQRIRIIEVGTENIKLKCMSLGATILDLQTKNKAGFFESVVMEFDSIEQYINNDLRLNQVVGPTAGRYEKGPYLLNNQSVTLKGNDGVAHLHGGQYGLSFYNFDVDVQDEDGIQIIFKAVIDEEDSYYPGTQVFTITYTIDESTLHIDFEADTTEDTLVNLTHHAYFNLSGNVQSQVLDHQLVVEADKHLALNDDFIPTKIEDVTNTHLDFRVASTLKGHLSKDIIARPEKGIDNPLLLSGDKRIRFYDPSSHRRLTIETDYPAVVVYSDNHNLGYTFKHLKERTPHMGCCFETQLAPNGINIDAIKTPLLKKGEHYHYRTSYRFDVAEGLDD